MNVFISMRQAAVAVIIATFFAGCGGETPEALLTSAKGYLAKSDNKAAEIQLKNALQKNPNLAEARFLLGTALLNSGDSASAEKELRKALELNYPAEQVVPPLARSMVSLGQHRKVIDEFANAKMATPQGQAELRTAIGQAQLALGNVDLARQAFNEARNVQPSYVPAHLGEAIIVARTKDFPKALAIADAALETSPQSEDAWQLKGDILLAQGNRTAALAAFRKAVELKPNSLQAHSAIISVLLQQKATDEAETQLKAVTQFAPKHPQTFFLQALLAHQQKNFTGARDAIQAQLKAAPDNVQGLTLSGAIEYELGSYTQSETQLLKVLRRMPEHTMARRILVAGYVRNGNAAKALQALTPELGRIENDADMLALTGEVYMINGDAGRAAEYFRKAVALDGDVDKRTTLALLRMAGGERDTGLRELESIATSDSGIRADLAVIAAHLRKRDYDAALGAISALEKKQQGKSLPHNLRGLALLGKGDRPAARKNFERALELDPTYFPAVVNLANLDIVEKKPDAAQKRLEAVIAKDPKHAQALLALAELRAKGGAKPEEVLALLKQAVAANPNDPGPRIGLIGYYVGIKDTSNAVVVARDASAAMPDRPEVMDAAGRAYEAAGEINQALSVYNKLASMQSSAVYPLIRIAELHVAAKNTTAAIESLRKALALQPDLVDAQRRIAALQRDSGRLPEAIATARTVQKQRPKQPIGYLMEGDLLAAEQRWAEATTAYKTGIRQAPSTDLAVRLHNTLSSTGDRTAQQFAATWLKDNPKDDAFRLHAAQAAAGGKDYATAAQHYRKLLESHPNNALMLNNLAWNAGKLRDPRALEYGEEANKLAPNQPAIMDTLGVLLTEHGQIARAVDLLQRASRLAPQAHEIRLNLAKALMASGKPEAARKELEDLAKLGDKFQNQDDVKRLMQKL